MQISRSLPWSCRYPDHCCGHADIQIAAVVMQISRSLLWSCRYPDHCCGHADIQITAVVMQISRSLLWSAHLLFFLALSSDEEFPF
jgi:hypothetical protein